VLKAVELYVYVDGVILLVAQNVMRKIVILELVLTLATGIKGEDGRMNYLIFFEMTQVSNKTNTKCNTKCSPQNKN